MSVYYCITGAKAVQANALVAANQIVQPLGQNNPNSPASAHSLQVVVNGIGLVSATVQFVGSNDGINFINYGSAVTVSSGQAPATAATSGTIPWTFIGAYITAISGTNAAVTATVSA